MSKNITERLTNKIKGEEARIEWQTRVLANFIANTAQSEEGVKSLVKAAGKISIRSTGADTDEAEEQGRSGKDDPAVFVEEGSQVARNKPGSTERLLQGFRA